MTSQLDSHVKATLAEIVARTPAIGDTPNEETIQVKGDPGGSNRSRVALAAAAATILCVGGLLAIRARLGTDRNSAATRRSAGVSGAEGSTTVDVGASGASTPASADTTPRMMATSAPAVTSTPTVTEPEAAAPPATAAPPLAFEPLRPGAVHVRWLPPGYTASQDVATSTASVQQVRLSAPTEPADDIWVRVDRDAAGAANLEANRPASAIDVQVRGATGYVEVVSAKHTSVLVFLDADGVNLIIYAPESVTVDTLVRIADGLTN